MKKKLDQFVTENLSQKTQVGISIGYLKDGESYFWNYGELKKNEGVLPTENSFFEIGSISKLYTASLLALEVLENKVQLTDPLSKYWTELQDKSTGKITLQELAMHTSGLPRLPSNLNPSDLQNPYKDYTESLLIEFMKEYERPEPSHTHPSVHQYSNLGFAVLGYVLAQKINRLPFEEYLQSRLLIPLGLLETKTTLNEKDHLRAALGYDSFLNLTPSWFLNSMEPAGALKSTAKDLIRFAELNLKQNPQSVFEKAFQLAQEPKHLIDTVDGARYQIGLGWFQLTSPTQSLLHHTGGTGGFTSNLILNKNTQEALVVLSNTDLVPECLSSLMTGKDCAVTKWQEISPDEMNLLSGDYFSSSINLQAKIFIENGFLCLRAEGQDKTRLWSEKENHFKVLEVNADVIVQKNMDEKVEGFHLTQNQQSFYFQKK